jgi:hypothetical protein
LKHGNKIAREVDYLGDALIAHWFPMTYALNTLNRDMGLADIYPFALSAPVIRKVQFVHEIVQQAGTEKAEV